MATQKDSNTSIDINTIKEHISNSHIQKLTKVFYQFICDIYISYCKNKKNINSKNNDLEETADENDTLFSDNFIKHLMYQFYNLKGIKRKNVGDKIVLLSYDKENDNYDPDDDLTKLCRHIILDTTCLRIISLGIPRRNNINTLDTGKLNEFTVEFQYDGSMVIYNPSLKNNSRMYQERENMGSTASENEEIVKIPIDVTFSTRNKVGTSNYNSGDPFKIICERNFKNFDFNLNQLNNGFESLVYVFNVMDKEEHISNEDINLLVSCYKFKNEIDCLTACKKIQSITNINEQSQKLVSVMFQDLASNMIKSLDINEISSIYSEMKLPEKLDKSDNNISKSTEMLKNLPYTYKGITIYDQDGARYKLINDNFEQIKNLRGDLPINLLDCNKKSLFKIYLRLKKENEIEKFLSYFDKNKNYKNTFIQIKKDIQEFTDTLHQWYMDAYVLKNKEKDDIPSYLYPLCFELHGIYMSNQKPIQKKDVLQYLYNIDVMSLYGRIYTPIPDLRNLKKEQQEEQPEKPSGEQPEKPSGEQPEEPSGEQPEKPSGEQPEKPSGEQPEEPSGEQPEKPSGEQVSN